MLNQISLQNLQREMNGMKVYCCIYNTNRSQVKVTQTYGNGKDIESA